MLLLQRLYRLSVCYTSPSNPTSGITQYNEHFTRMNVILEWVIEMCFNVCLKLATIIILCSSLFLVLLMDLIYWKYVFETTISDNIQYYGIDISILNFDIELF